MKVKIDRGALFAKLTHVTKALPVKTSLTALTGVKFVANAQGVYLTASDSDITINAFVPVGSADSSLVDVETPGEVIIPGKYFFDIIRKLEADIIEINTFEDNDILIRSDKGEYTLKGLDVLSYPRIEMPKEHQTLMIPTKLLKTIISQTIFSVALNESRPILTGVNMSFDGGELNCVATDSFRLSKKVVPLDSEGLEPFNITIPGRSFNELSKILDVKDEQTEISIARNQVRFKNDEISFQSRLLEGQYPDTESFVPKSFAIQVKANYRELFHAIDRVALMAKEERANVAKIEIVPEENIVTLKANSPEIGKIEETVKIKAHKGSPLRIACSSLFLLDSLKAIQNVDADVIMGFNGEMKPFVLIDERDETNLQLIVPVRIED